MFEEVKLKKSCMALELPDGKVFLLHNEDVDQLVHEFWMRMILKEQPHVIMLKDTGLDRARLLYQTYRNESKDMDDKLKQKYLENILKYIMDNNFELTTLEEEIKKKNP